MSAILLVVQCVGAEIGITGDEQRVRCTKPVPSDAQERPLLDDDTGESEVCLSAF